MPQNVKFNEACLSREVIDLSLKGIKSFDDEDNMAELNHIENWRLNVQRVLVFLSGLLQIQIVREVLRLPRGRAGAGKFYLDDNNKCI